jgi:hypothetical protein
LPTIYSSSRRRNKNPWTASPEWNSDRFSSSRKKKKEKHWSVFLADSLIRVQSYTKHDALRDLSWFHFSVTSSHSFASNQAHVIVWFRQQVLGGDDAYIVYMLTFRFLDERTSQLAIFWLRTLNVYLVLVVLKEIPFKNLSTLQYQSSYIWSWKIIFESRQIYIYGLFSDID